MVDICGVCLNPCNDRLVKVDHLEVGGLNRIRSARFDIAGKGVNLSRVCSRLGMKSACTGFMFKDNGHLTVEALNGDQVAPDFVWGPGAVRTNLKIFDMQTEHVTEINEPGISVNAHMIGEMREKVQTWAQRSRYVVMTGSLPPGCDKEEYARLLRIVREQGAQGILDAEGDMLELGIRETPLLIKPNKFELETISHRALNTLEEIAAAAQAVQKRGIQYVAVSLGHMGAMLCDSEQVLYTPPMKIPVRSSVGAGDSMMAGLLSQLIKGESSEQMLRHGAAAASASVMTEGTELVYYKDYEKLIPEVEIKKM